MKYLLVVLNLAAGGNHLELGMHDDKESCMKNGAKVSELLNVGQKLPSHYPICVGKRQERLGDVLQK